MLVYLRRLKELFVPLWQADTPVAGDLESHFKISWSTLTEFAKQAASGMAFLEENKVSIMRITIILLKTLKQLCLIVDKIKSIRLRILYTYITYLYQTCTFVYALDSQVPIIILFSYQLVHRDVAARNVLINADMVIKVRKSIIVFHIPSWDIYKRHLFDGASF